jgi:hypothetical protein
MKTVLVFWIGGALVYAETFAIWATLRRGEVRLASQLEIARAITALVLVVVFLAGCASDGATSGADPHEIVPCDPSSWPSPDVRCELACEAFPTPPMPMTACKVTVYESPPMTVFCSLATETEFGGTVGCCHVSGTPSAFGDIAVRFLECQP